MASPQTSEQPPPHIDPTQAPVAFGSWAIPKLMLELQDAELFTRQRALAALCELVHDHERAYEAILSGKLILKGIVRTKILIPSLGTHPHVNLNT